MYWHMFAFRLKAGVTEETKSRMLLEIRALGAAIPGLLEAAVGRNESPRAAGYEIGGVMKFADQASFENYGGHPEHQKLLEWLLPLVEPVEVDFRG